MSNHAKLPPVRDNRYSGLMSAIEVTVAELQLINKVDELIDSELLDAYKLRRKKWLNYYISEINKLGNDPGEYSEAGKVSSETDGVAK